MRLIPQVKQLILAGQKFSLCEAEAIHINNSSTDLLGAASFLKERIKILTGINIALSIGDRDNINGIILRHDEEDSEEYRIFVEKDRIILEGRSASALFWAIQTLLQIISLNGQEIPCLQITDFPDFRHRGFYHDVTRGKVPKLSTLKSLIEKLAYYKINELQLYVEHSFAFRNIPELWGGRDPLTSEEILELDHYSKRFHIDLIPSLASFGHLYELLRLKRFEHLNELNIKASEIPQNLWDRMAHYTIDPTNDESYKLIKSMIEEYLPLFSSKYFNICCDETFDLGKGKNLLRVQKEGTGTLYLEFVSKLIDLVRSHGKTPMLWGDIILKHPELIKQVPRDVVFLNWGYGADITDENIRILADTGVRQYVCPGTQGWSRVAYDIGTASDNIRKMVQFGFQYKAVGVLNTDWGDCGHINLFAGMFHGMIFGAALCWNKESYSDDDFDRAVSVLEWGDKSETLYRLLRELGGLCFYHFGNIYAWVSGTEGLWNKEQKVKEIGVGELQNNYDRAVEVLSKLINLRAIGNQKRLEFDELVFGAKATVWTLALLLFKKRHEYNQRLEIPVAKAELIKMGYDVLAELIRLWRIRNKESELQNVVAVFRKVLEKVQGL
jgi:hypothetical protein